MVIQEVDGGIIFPRLGPILVKNSQKWLAISIRSVISLLSTMKEGCTLFLIFFLSIISFNSLQVDFIFNLHSSNFFSK